MTDRQELIDEIDGLSRLDLCRAWRFAPTGHKYFTDYEIGLYFHQRLKDAGGFSPEISKELGWEDARYGIPVGEVGWSGAAFHNAPIGLDNA
jgi:hypothetical protein